MATDTAQVAAGTEFATKLALVRAELAANDLAAVRLRGNDWFAWLTCGGSSVVDTSTDRGVAELLVTASDALVLADRIDGARLRDEEVAPRAPDLEVLELPWADPGARDAAVGARGGRGGRVASDRPRGDELALPAGLVAARRRLMPDEAKRLRAVSVDAASALTRVLLDARPDMTETQLAAMVAEEVAERATPIVVLVGGARRLPLYRHPTPREGEPLGARAMVVVCARRHGLVANLTRLAYFREPTDTEQATSAAVADVEAAAFAASVPGATLGEVYRAIAGAYAAAGFAGAEADHHQGGLAGYRSREEVATPASATPIAAGSALAWNPSLPGAKMEDTVLVTGEGLEILTVDPAWPTVTVAGRRRPDVLVLA